MRFRRERGLLSAWGVKTVSCWNEWVGLSPIRVPVAISAEHEAGSGNSEFSLPTTVFFILVPGPEFVPAA